MTMLTTVLEYSTELEGGFQHQFLKSGKNHKLIIDEEVLYYA